MEREHTREVEDLEDRLEEDAHEHSEETARMEREHTREVEDLEDSHAEEQRRMQYRHATETAKLGSRVLQLEQEVEDLQEQKLKAEAEIQQEEARRQQRLERMSDDTPEARSQEVVVVCVQWC